MTQRIMSTLTGPWTSPNGTRTTLLLRPDRRGRGGRVAILPRLGGGRHLACRNDQHDHRGADNYHHDGGADHFHDDRGAYHFYHDSGAHHLDDQRGAYYLDHDRGADYLDDNRGAYYLEHDRGANYLDDDGGTDYLDHDRGAHYRGSHYWWADDRGARGPRAGRGRL
jgi:hypothetical protein